MKWFWIFCIVLVLGTIGDNQLTIYQENRFKQPAEITEINQRLDKIEDLTQQVYDAQTTQIATEALERGY